MNFYFKKGLLLFCNKSMKFLMKTFIFLFCSVVFSFSSEGLMSQNAKIKIDADKEVTIDGVFDLIMSQTDLVFMYQVDMFKGYSKLQLKKGEIKVGELLKRSLPSKDFSFKVVKEKASTRIIIEKTLSELQEIFKISGTVKDSNGIPIPGVTAYISNEKPSTNTNDVIIRGTATDFEGKFTINVSLNQYLVVTGIGYESYVQKITTTNNKSYDVILKESVNQLEEVVIVSTGYQKISKERATGAFVGVKKDQLEKPASSISERLVGQVAGLQSRVNSDGSIDLEIRGQSSLFEADQPLIVYDGFPIQGGFETINPNDVESVTVLKDAAAASIWGAKSAGGVIVVTSKKGKEGKTDIAISSFVKISPKLDVDYSTGRASSAEVIGYEKLGFDSGFFGSPFGGAPSNSVFDAFSPYSLGITAMNEARLGTISNTERDAILARLANSNNKDQIRNYLLDVPMTKQVNISISGGSSRMKNRLTLLFEDNNTFFKGTESNKYQVDFASNVELTKKLRFDFAGMLQNTSRDNNGTNLGFISSLAPYDMLKNPDGSLVDMSYLTFYNPNVERHISTGLFPYTDWSFNPISDINERDFNTKTLNYRIQTGLSLEVIEGLNLTSKIQYETFKTNVENYYKEGAFEVRRFLNAATIWDYLPNSVPIEQLPKGGILKQNETTVNAYNFRNQLSFDRTFADKHNISFVAGSEIAERTRKFINSPDTYGYNGDRLSAAALDFPSGASFFDGLPFRYSGFFYPFRLVNNVFQFRENTERFFSLYSNLAYAFDNRYTVSGSYRTDASNIIADDPLLRYNAFWSVGTTWNAHNEAFLQETEWLNRLKFRATLGYNGNIPGSESFEPLIGLNPTPDPSSGEIDADIQSYGNPSLRWERTRTLNFGLDFSVFNSKLYGSVELYNRESTNLIVSQALSGVYGTTRQKINSGEMVNEGVEITLGTTMPIKGNDVVWSGSVNFAHNNNKITNLFKTNYQSYDLAYEVFNGDKTSAYVDGYDANTIWGYQYGGLTNFGTETNPNFKPSIIGENGQPIDLTSFPAGNAINYMKPQGTSQAPTTVGIRNSFKIYDFNFSFIVTGKFGHVFRRQGFNYDPLSGGNTVVNTKYNEVINGDPNQVIPIPEVESRYYFYSRFFNHMSYLTQDASHIRFQEVSLSYTLPKKVTNNLGINSFNLFAQANNIGAILFNDFNEDPEYPIGNLRLQKSFTLGINFNF